MIVSYSQVSKAAGLMLVPYLLWLLFSTAINGWIVHHNASFAEMKAMQTSGLDHDKYMRIAIELAQENPRAPFAAVLVDQKSGEIVATGLNQSSSNPTLHGEIAAINTYAQLEGDDWQELTLYTTAEPCCMCQGAILWAGIAEVVFGTSIAELRRIGWKQIDIPAHEVIARSWKPDIAVLGGVRAEECDQLFRKALTQR